MEHKNSPETGATRIQKVITAESGAILGISLAASDYETGLIVPAGIILTILLMYSAARANGSISRPACISGCFLTGLGTIYISFGTFFSLEALLCTLLLIYMVNNIIRTAGGNGGNRISTNIGILITYGILAVLFPYMICAHEIASWKLLLPALSIGLFGTSLFAGNNRLASTSAILLALVFFLCFNLLRIHDMRHYLPFAVIPAFAGYIVCLWKDRPVPKRLLAISILLFSISAGAGYLAYLF